MYKYCVLVEIPNEENQIAIGYAQWLKNDWKDIDELSKLKEEDELLEIQWPDDINIEPPGTISKKLLKCKWSSKLVKILDYGGKGY